MVNEILASCAQDRVSIPVCFLKSLPCGSGSASILYKKKSDGNSHAEAPVLTPEAISGKVFQRLTKENATIDGRKRKL